MKYFRLITKDIDVKPLLAEIYGQEDAWLANTTRQDKIRVQRETNTIFLRNAVKRPDLVIEENQESGPTRISTRFPFAIAFMNHVAAQLKCQLSRATIVRLKPRSEVGVHIDAGSYYLIRHRFHLVLRSSCGSVLRAGNEQVRMQEGELWWFDNKQHHSAFNESSEWRIHYIFDLLPPAYARLAVNPAPLDQLPTDIVASALGEPAPAPAL
jgi:hypothetical protein